MLYDVLEYSYLSAGNVQTIKIRRGSLEVGPGCFSYVQFEDEHKARAYIPLHRVDFFRYTDHSRSTP